MDTLHDFMSCYFSCGEKFILSDFPVAWLPINTCYLRPGSACLLQGVCQLVIAISRFFTEGFTFTTATSLGLSAATGLHLLGCRFATGRPVQNDQAVWPGLCWFNRIFSSEDSVLQDIVVKTGNSGTHKAAPFLPNLGIANVDTDKGLQDWHGCYCTASRVDVAALDPNCTAKSSSTQHRHSMHIYCIIRYMENPCPKSSRAVLMRWHQEPEAQQAVPMQPASSRGPEEEEQGPLQLSRVILGCLWHVWTMQ